MLGVGVLAPVAVLLVPGGRSFPGCGNGNGEVAVQALLGDEDAAGAPVGSEDALDGQSLRNAPEGEFNVVLKYPCKTIARNIVVYP